MSGSRTRTSPMPGLAQPRPSRLGGMDVRGMFSADQGGFGAQGSFSESNSFQQGGQRRESSYNTSRREEFTSDRSEEATKRVETIEESRSRRRRFTLADCRLELEQSTLTISPASREDDFVSNTVNLDDFVGNISGELVWGAEAVNFSESCTSIRLAKTFLIASCSRGTDVVPGKLNLDDHIAYIASTRRFEPILPDPAFAELMSSANWMNFTVITQPDMRNFLRSPAFQSAVGLVARNAVEEVLKQMRTKMMEAIETAIKAVTAESDEFVQSEMETLVKKATKTAAYTGLGQLKLMQLEQRRAFNIFAPHISAAPIVEEVEPEDD
ncbi:hypothetical protein MSAN_02072000 [Mycena sanguinolenta]|uniref:Cyanovirin-N domain-containing protein n=1 Tax=Mycena sanguinolenta TaxID=230812 RepID=A0A8H6XIK9_9AGAR|nr:hypothetical protein MSAN_02072000 [Mycena sanguinolenta]